MQIKFELTGKELKAHHSACEAGREHNLSEAKICRALREVYVLNVHKKLGHTSLYQYAVGEMQLSPAVAYSTNAVARQSAKVPELRKAIDEGRVSVPKASRLLSTLTSENASEVIAFAETHNFREIEEEIARRQPKKTQPDRWRPIGNDKMEVLAQVPTSVHAEVKRTESLLASKGKPTTLASVLQEAVGLWLERHDPLRRAERAQARRTKRARKRQAAQSDGREAKAVHVTHEACKDREAHEVRVTHEARDSHEGLVDQVPQPNLCAHRDSVTQASADGKLRTSGTDGANATKPSRPTRPPRSSNHSQLRAWTKHELILRTGNRCTFVNERGERCTEERWLDRHHIIPLSQGGSDEPSNLTHLCSTHHALVHQLSLPIDGQITWLSSPRAAYLA